MRTPVLVLLGFALWGTVTFSLAQSGGEACASCHEDQQKKVQTSAHTSLACSSCHQKHEEYPHPAGVPKPVCSDCHSEIAANYARSVHGQSASKGNAAAPTCSVCHGSAHELKQTKSEAFHSSVPDTCGMCHTEISDKFKASVHGQAVAKGIGAAPVCTSCHGEHSILSPKSELSTVNPKNIRDTCGQCHGNVRLAERFGLPSDRIVSFDASFHGLAAKSGSQSVANCASCHGFHDILPSSDSKSSTNAKNLPSTCGRCHAGAGTRFAIGQVHLAENSQGESPAVIWARWAYRILIPLTIGLMLLHNGGDWLRKLFRHRFKARQPGIRLTGLHKPEVRMFGFERFQHALTAISFIVLVWTGFALKYPQHWWAQPLVHWERYFPVRGTVHRIAAVVMIVAGVMHVISLIASRRLREHWKELLPKRSDVPEAIAGFAYNLGLISTKPKISSHSYIEKAEYWAVVWGTIVMGATGVILWANNWALRFLPKSVSDLATAVHLYEAILAALAILVWHFYSVIFDPEVYPLETAFLTGKSVKRHESEEREEAELEESLIADNANNGSSERN